MSVAKPRGLTLERLGELLKYNAETGALTWKHARSGIKKSGAAGCKRPDGYVQICIDRTIHKAHNLAWLFHHGAWPAKSVDHINGVRDDNRIANLRLATPQQQRFNAERAPNNTSGYSGVSWRKTRGKWWARIKIDKITKHLGYFTSKEEAIAARKAAEDKYGFTEWVRKENV